MTEQEVANPDLEKAIIEIMEETTLVVDSDVIDNDAVGIVSLQLHKMLKETYQDLIIDKKNFFIVVVKCVELVDSAKDLTSKEKKMVVVNVLKEFIKDLDLDDDLEKDLLDNSLDSIIETVINASRNKFKFKKKKDKKVEKKSVKIIVDELVEKIVNMVKDNEMGPIYITANITSIVGTLIEVVRDYPYLSKAHQKDVIEHAILKFIKKKLPELVGLSPNDKAFLDISTFIVPQAVDIIFAINDSEFLINIKNNKCVKKYLCCCCY